MELRLRSARHCLAYDIARLPGSKGLPLQRRPHRSDVGGHAGEGRLSALPPHLIDGLLPPLNRPDTPGMRLAQPPAGLRRARAGQRIGQARMRPG